jgi:hypothetical protein
MTGAELSAIEKRLVDIELPNGGLSSTVWVNFLGHAESDMRALLDEVKRLREFKRAVKMLHGIAHIGDAIYQRRGDEWNSTVGNQFDIYVRIVTKELNR